MTKRLETETVVSWNDQESVAYISTRQKTTKNKLRKLGVKPSYQQADYECYEVPKSWIKISKPRKVSDEQRQAARDRINKINSEPDSHVVAMGNQN